MQKSGFIPGVDKMYLSKFEFISQIRPDNMFNTLFEHFDDICFFVKDLDGRLLMANSQLLKRYNLKNESEIIGMTDYDFVPQRLAEKYREDDLRIIKSGKPMLNILELALNSIGIPDWFITNKLPVIGKNDRVIGIMGTFRNLSDIRTGKDGSNYFYKVLQYMDENYSMQLSIKELAQYCGLSIRNFELKFKQIMNMSPRQYLIKVRIFKSCDSLRNRKSISKTAVDCGFYDQCSFTRYFKKHMGLTPKQYIKKYMQIVY